MSRYKYLGEEEDLGNMRALLNEAIENFLQERRESDGGWAAVTEEDMEQLHAILYCLVDLKCEQDPDGDVPIEYELINRRICYKPPFDPMPYPNYNSEDPGRGKQLMDSFRAALYNLQVATREMDEANKAIQYEETLRREAREAKENEDGLA